jgi:hypothetical protein
MRLQAAEKSTAFGAIPRLTRLPLAPPPCGGFRWDSAKLEALVVEARDGAASSPRDESRRMKVFMPSTFMCHATGLAFDRTLQLL